MIIQYFPINAEQILPLIFLYTEIHHRFKFFGSKYFKKEPEINADIPHRVEPAHDIPLLILIKDSHKFPVTLLKIDINISNRKENHGKSKGNDRARRDIICLGRYYRFTTV